MAQLLAVYSYHFSNQNSSCKTLLVSVSLINLNRVGIHCQYLNFSNL